MSRRLNLVGQKFGKLTCLEFIEVNKQKHSIFKFECDCGNIVINKGSEVKNGHTTSCGCTIRDNLVGEKYGFLNCISFIGVNHNRHTVFEFKCDCGNTVEILGASVKSGHTTSCGCYQKDKASKTILTNSKFTGLNWCYGTTRMRSGYEIFYAYYLDQCGIDWEYEPETFKLENGIRYTPDFYLPESNTWIEIKGRITEENRKKIFLFRTQTGNKLKVYFLKDLEKLAGESYKSFIKENKEYYL